MSDHILYNFQANNASLEDINSLVNGIGEVQNDINNLFATLATVYEGQGAAALAQAHNNLNGMLDDVLQNFQGTQRQASDQQTAMHALDQHNASAF